MAANGQSKEDFLHPPANRDDWEGRQQAVRREQLEQTNAKLPKVAQSLVR